MDPTNLRILDLLQHDGRISVADIARHVGRAESTVRERLAALEANGVVRGYRALLDHGRLGQPTRAVIRASCDLKLLPQVHERLASIPQVTRVLVTTGPQPLLIEAVTRDLATLERLLVERLGPLNLETVSTDVVVDELTDRPVALQTLAEEDARPPAVRTPRPMLSPTR